MTSSHHGLYGQGYTRATMTVQKVANPRGGANRIKPVSVRIAGCRVELQTPIRTETGFMGFAQPRGIAALCTGHCSMFAALDIRGMMT